MEQLPAIEHAPRRAALAAALDEVGAGLALVVTGPANVRWATGFTGTNGQLVLCGKDAWLVTDARYEGRAAVECPGLDVVLERDWIGAALQIATRADAAALAFEGDHVSHHRATGLQDRAADDTGLAVLAVHGLVEGLRTVKDDAELARLEVACRITEDVLDAVCAAGLAGRSEREVARQLEDGFRARDAEVAFPSIVAAGPNGAVPHHEPTDRPLAAGELVTIDCGARVDGYHADTTRTLAVGRVPSDASLVEVFTEVAAAQQAGVEAAVVGATAGAVDAACRTALEDAGLGAAFVHGTGHGVGLEIHEEPWVSRGAGASLRHGTALTVEPGAYLPGRGGVRIEDTVVVTTTGPRRLTSSPHDLRVV